MIRMTLHTCMLMCLRLMVDVLYYRYIQHSGTVGWMDGLLVGDLLEIDHQDWNNKTALITSALVSLSSLETITTTV